MPSHEDKYISNLLFGFGSIIAGVMVILYASFERVRYDDWYIWGLAASVLLCLGSYLMLQAFLHKIKSDLSRRQKQRHLYKETRENEAAE